MLKVAVAEPYLTYLTRHAEGGTMRCSTVLREYMQRYFWWGTKSEWDGDEERWNDINK